MKGFRLFRGFTVRATITIHAPQAVVWAILTDLDHYSAWNTFTPAIQSSLVVGSLLTMDVQLRKHVRMKMAETVTIMEHEHQLAWKARYPAWYLHSERIQTLLPFQTDSTEYETHETFTGLMAPLLQLLLGRYLQRKFENTALELKDRVEMLISC